MESGSKPNDSIKLTNMFDNISGTLLICACLVVNIVFAIVLAICDADPSDAKATWAWLTCGAIAPGDDAPAGELASLVPASIALGRGRIC